MAVSPRPILEDALRLGRHKFLVGQRIDMSAIAHELGINRVTLYRWIGSRDRLLVEVIWSLADRTITVADQSTSARGAERIVQIATRFIDTVIANPGMQAWLADEGEHAMRLLTRHETDFQPRLIDAIERLLAEETDAGRLDLPADLHDLAYVMVRLLESYIYLDLITGEDPQTHSAEPILRMLLR
ncbi:MAG: QsdR family transcriptional regulator [Solirubrobacteraceae bacterium]